MVRMGSEYRCIAYVERRTKENVSCVKASTESYSTEEPTGAREALPIAP